MMRSTTNGLGWSKERVRHWVPDVMGRICRDRADPGRTVCPYNTNLKKRSKDYFVEIKTMHLEGFQDIPPTI